MPSSRLPFLPASAESRAATAGDHPEPVFLLVTGDEELRDDVALVAAVVGGRLECRPGWVETPGTDWAAVMCGPDALPPNMLHADHVLLLGRGAGDSDDESRDLLWRLAASRPGVQAVPLPEGEIWLSEYLGSRVMDRAPGCVIGVAGVFGGVGATTISYLLAAEAAARGLGALLVDGDPHPGSGIRSLLAEQSLGGRAEEEQLGWSGLARIEGELSSSQLQAALPVLEGIHVVTEVGERFLPGDGAGGTVPLRTAEAVVSAGKRAFDLVVVDAGRGTGLLRAVAERTDAGLLVAPASRRAADAADDLLADVGGPPFHLVLNGRSRPGWRSAEMQEALGLPVVADIAEQRWLKSADDLGEAYELLRSSRGAALVEGILEATGAVHG